MKKILLGLLLLILCAGGWLYWQWSRIDVSFDDMNEIAGEIQPGEDQESPDASHKTKESPKEVIEKQVQKELEKPPVEQSSSSTPEQLEKAIIDRYQNAFSTMRKGYEGQLSEMIGRAKREYAALSDQEKKKAKMTLALKYLKMGNALEDACDDSFKKVLDQMHQELVENGLPTDAVKEAKSQYEKEKSARRKTLMDKAF